MEQASKKQQNLTEIKSKQKNKDFFKSTLQKNSLKYEINTNRNFIAIENNIEAKKINKNDISSFKRLSRTEAVKQEKRTIILRLAYNSSPEGLESIIIFQTQIKMARQTKKATIQSQEKKRGYAKIGLCRREKLINKVIVQRKSLFVAAKSMKIKLSTAKAILSRYRNEGVVHLTKKDKQKIKESKKKTQPAQPELQQTRMQETNSYWLYWYFYWCWAYYMTGKQQYQGINFCP